MMRSLNQANYKEAYLYHPRDMDTSKEWMVIYYYRIPGTEEFQQFKERFRMNKIKDAKERYFYGTEAAKWMNEKLQAGFNPFEAVNLKSQSSSTSGKKLPAILVQLDIIVKEEKEGATDSKKNSYTEQYNRFKKFIEEKKLEQKLSKVVPLIRRCFF